MIIEKLEFETVPPQFENRDGYKMWEKINEIIDFININEAQSQSKQWIPCVEQLPEKNQQVIYCDKCGLVGFALYTENNTFWDNCIEFNDVIAWQALPEPYKEHEK